MDGDNVWIYSWNEPKLFGFDATAILALPLLLLILALADLGVWNLVKMFSALLVGFISYEIYIAFILKVSVVVSFRIVKMKLLGRRRPAKSALFEAYIYDPHGMSGWRARLYADQNGERNAHGS